MPEEDCIQLDKPTKDAIDKFSVNAWFWRTFQVGPTMENIPGVIYTDPNLIKKGYTMYKYLGHLLGHKYQSWQISVPTQRFIPSHTPFQ